MKNKNMKVKWNASEKEMNIRGQILDLFKQTPIPENEILMNLPLFINRQNLASLLFMVELYQKAKEVHGVIFEFGVRWGRNLALFEALRGIYEPYNHNRKIVGFDTFAGFPSVDKKDGRSEAVQVGAYNVTTDYEKYLAEILNYHEQESPISHIKKFELRKGDATKEVKKYLEENPQTIIAMAYFDFDIYEPTKKCLESILPHLTKGSVIGFDELNCKDYPGETLAFKEVLGLSKYKIHHSPLTPTQSYIVIE